MRGGVGFAAALVLSASVMAAVFTVETVEGQSSPVATTQVSLYGNAFLPPDIIVLKGSKVTWTNKDTVAHTATNDGGGEIIEEPFAPSAAGPLAVQDYTFNNLGVVKYYCRIHAGMRGSVTVVEKFDPVQVPVVEVRADDSNEFLPRGVALNLSQGITWTNPGENLHDVTFEAPSIGSLGDLPAGGRLSHNFTREGTYVYRCKYHAADFSGGMVGRVVVGGNATLPVLVAITSLRPGQNVSDNVSIEGTADPGIGQPAITAIELDLDGSGNWTLATGTTSWSLRWESWRAPDGQRTMVARAVANGTELARTSIDVVVANAVSTAAPPSSRADSPGLGILAALGAVVWVATRRRT